MNQTLSRKLPSFQFFFLSSNTEKHETLAMHRHEILSHIFDLNQFRVRINSNKRVSLYIQVKIFTLNFNENLFLKLKLKGSLDHDPISKHHPHPPCFVYFQLPPAPPRPDFDASRAKLQKLSDSESTLTKEEYQKMKQELEAFEFSLCSRFV